MKRNIFMIGALALILLASCEMPGFGGNDPEPIKESEVTRAAEVLGEPGSGAEDFLFLAGKSWESTPFGMQEKLEGLISAEMKSPMSFMTESDGSLTIEHYVDDLTWTYASVPDGSWIIEEREDEDIIFKAEVRMGSDGGPEWECSDCL